jgi:hypothetical protein
VTELPSTLTHLTFGKYFDQKVNNLPKTLTHLTFGEHFNQKVNNLPKTLTHLTFDNNSKFDKEVNELPLTLTNIIFGEYFDQKKLINTIELSLRLRPKPPLIYRWTVNDYCESVIELL